MEAIIKLVRQYFLRDYFAAMALNALIIERAGGAVNPEELAQSAYHWADLMLKARRDTHA